MPAAVMSAKASCVARDWATRAASAVVITWAAMPAALATSRASRVYELGGLGGGQFAGFGLVGLGRVLRGGHASLHPGWPHSAAFAME